MLEVDSVRRAFYMGSQDQVMYTPLSLSGPAQPLPRPDPRSMPPIPWIQPTVAPTPTPEPKSDGELEDEDEYRPFTPPPPRERLSYTRYQLELLNGIYIQVRYPNSTQKQLIAKRVGITREQVKIWFQNRRRKDVVGNGGGEKSTAALTEPGKSENSEVPAKTKSPAEDSGNSSEDSSSSKESDPSESVVPSVVLKSIIGELVRFEKDPLKGKKNRKKAKSKSSKAKEKEKVIKKGLANTLLQGGYDMISPPNQTITPSAFFDKIKAGFNHSKVSSAFESPRQMMRSGIGETVLNSSSDSSPPQIHSITSVHQSGSNNHGNGMHASGPPGHFLHGNCGLPTPVSSQSGLNPQFEIPVLSELLTYKSCLEARHKVMSAVHGRVLSSASHPGPDTDICRLQNTVPNPNRAVNGVFPFPFIADQQVLLSSLRQPDQIFRPYPHYPSTLEDPYQPLLISSLANPYYSSSNLAHWTNHNITSPPSYTHLQ